MDDAPDRLRTLLVQLGAEAVSSVKGGHASDEAYLVSGLMVHISSEYGVSRVNLSLGSSAQLPASFWLAALDGHADYPDPAVTEEDLPRLIARLPELIGEAPRLSPAVVAMGKQYSNAMRSRFER